MALKVLRELRKRSRKRYKDSLGLIPHIFTFANAFFGFFSIVHVLEGNLLLAAYCLVIAVCMDIADGFLARILRTTSYFGAELDTLCDAISFCLAPAILLYSAYCAPYGRLGMVLLTIYLCAGLFRLARFNSSPSTQNYFFVGLPSTAAAFFVANLILYHDWLAAGYLRWMVTDNGTMSIIILLAFLMVSTFHYPSWKGYRFTMVPYAFLCIPFCGIISFCVVNHYPVFFLLLFAYIIAGFLVGLLTIAKRLLTLIL